MFFLFKESQSLASQQFDDQEKATEDLKKDISELGIEVVDQISALTGKQNSHLVESVENFLNVKFIGS